MERDDVKRRRIMELAIVERVKQGLPLQKDALAYLINHFDLESLNRFCSTSWTMQQFCKENQVWRKKFARLFPTLLDYWDRLIGVLGDDAKEHRLLMSFLILLNGLYIPHPDERIEVNFFNPENTANSLYFHVVKYDGYFKVDREKIIAYGKDGVILTDDYLYTQESKTFPLLFRNVSDLDANEREWYGFSLDDSDEEEIFLELNRGFPGDDAILVIYTILRIGYRRQFVDDEDDDIPWNNFKKIVAPIGNCAHCATPKAKTVCGLCEQVAYCGQKCADKHWKNHNCAATK